MHHEGVEERFKASISRIFPKNNYMLEFFGSPEEEKGTINPDIMDPLRIALGKQSSTINTDFLSPTIRDYEFVQKNIVEIRKFTTKLYVESYRKFFAEKMGPAKFSGERNLIEVMKVLQRNDTTFESNFSNEIAKEAELKDFCDFFGKIIQDKDHKEVFEKTKEIMDSYAMVAYKHQIIHAIIEYGQSIFNSLKQNFDQELRQINAKLGLPYIFGKMSYKYQFYFINNRLNGLEQKLSDSETSDSETSDSETLGECKELLQKCKMKHYTNKLISKTEVSTLGNLREVKEPKFPNFTKVDEAIETLDKRKAERVDCSQYIENLQKEIDELVKQQSINHQTSTNMTTYTLVMTGISAAGAAFLKSLKNGGGIAAGGAFIVNPAATLVIGASMLGLGGLVFLLDTVNGHDDQERQKSLMAFFKSLNSEETFDDYLASKNIGQDIANRFFQEGIEDIYEYNFVQDLNDAFMC